jgi:hypothetical protein
MAAVISVQNGLRVEFAWRVDLHQDKRMSFLSGVYDERKEATCCYALAEVLEFTSTPKIREKKHHLHVFWPDPTFEFLRHVLEHRSDLKQVQGHAYLRRGCRAECKTPLAV